VLIVDDHPVYRRGLRDILRSNPHMECVGECGSAAVVLEAIETLNPSIILMDVLFEDHDSQSQGLNGFEITKLIKTRFPTTRVLILSMFDTADSVRDAFNAGAHGYLVKDAGKKEIIGAILEVMNGGTPISPHIRDLHTAFLKQNELNKTDLGRMDSTQRIREVMELLAQGLTNDEIGRRLVLAPKTVRNYVSSAFQEVGADNRKAAIALLRDRGYGKGSTSGHQGTMRNR
jgi:DNA-binding NarL/FixJ family response regulator